METIFHSQRAASFLWVTSIISLPPEAQRKQLFWICTNKRSCYYSNHRTLWESSPLILANRSSLHPPSFPFLHQCRLPLDKKQDWWFDCTWGGGAGWMNTSLCIYTLQELEDLLLAKAYERAAELILDHLLAWFPWFFFILLKNTAGLSLSTLMKQCCLFHFCFLYQLFSHVHVPGAHKHGWIPPVDC